MCSWSLFDSWGECAGVVCGRGCGWLGLFGCCSDGCGGWISGMVGLRGWWLVANGRGWFLVRGSMLAWLLDCMG